MVVASMEAVEAGTFGGEVLYGTQQNGTLSAGALSDLVPADVQEKYLAYIPKDRSIITVSNRAHRAGDIGDKLTAKGYKIAGPEYFAHEWA